MPPRHGRAHAQASSLDDVFDRGTVPAAHALYDAQESIYATGDEDDSMYLIESGQVKLYMTSAGGKDCVVAIYATGEVFGESCFVGPKRFETAEAMIPTSVRRLARRDFLAELQRSGTTETLIRHMAARIAERQATVFDLVTITSERRLAKLLLDVAEKYGISEGEYLVIDHRISHEELSEIVGTTRPRITKFMQNFRRRGLITKGRPIRVHRAKIVEYIGGDRS